MSRHRAPYCSHAGDRESLIRCDSCRKYNRQIERRGAFLGALAFAGIVAVLGACSFLYGWWVYGDWKCGLPGVQCRRMVGAERTEQP